MTDKSITTNNPDAKLIELFQLYVDLRTLADDPTQGEEGSRCKRQIASALYQKIIRKPARGPAGIAVKLALSGTFVLKWPDDTAGDHNATFAPIRAAFLDAMRLSGVKLAPYERVWADGSTLRHPHKRKAA